MQGRRPAPAGPGRRRCGHYARSPRGDPDKPSERRRAVLALHVPAWGRGWTSVPGSRPGMPFLGEDDTLGAAEGQRQRLNGPTSD
nr:MAG TPA: hypothetical protein [Caudoviricetes sp.]